MMYRIGQFTKRIQLERDVRTPDGMGGFELTPYIFAKCWAYYRQKSTREILQGQQKQSTGSGIFVIRNRNDLLPTDRIVYKNMRFNIVGIPPYDFADQFLELEVEYGVAT